jgi:hypothetical protein
LSSLHNRPKLDNGLRLYTTALQPVSLAGFYRDASAFLILSGPSATSNDLAKLSARGLLTMGVNNSWAVYRPQLWTCADNPGRFLDTGWRDPGILKFVPFGSYTATLREGRSDGPPVDLGLRLLDMPGVLFFRRSQNFDHDRYLDEDLVCWGNPSDTRDSLGIKGKRSVMLIALRLLYYLGVRTVYLVGADFKMVQDRAYSFEEGRTEKSVKHNNALYSELARRFVALKPHFEARGFRVLNCSPPSELDDAFERIGFDEAVKRASSLCSRPVSTRGWYQPVEEEPVASGPIVNA